MSNSTCTEPSRPTPWNKDRLIGQKPPLKLWEIWSVRTQLRMTEKIRDLALLNLTIDSKLRRCDLVALRVRDVTHGEQLLSRASVVEHKIGAPVRFELAEQTRGAVQAWIKEAGLSHADYLFPSRQSGSPHLSTRQHSRAVKRWIGVRLSKAQSLYCWLPGCGNLIRFQRNVPLFSVTLWATRTAVATRSFSSQIFNLRIHVDPLRATTGEIRQGSSAPPPRPAGSRSFQPSARTGGGSGAAPAPGASWPSPPSRAVGRVKRRDHGLLDLGAGESVRERGESVEVEALRILAALLRWMAKMRARTAGSGRSTKKISSKRPLRSSSGGRASMSLAVATMNTFSLRSAIQVSRVPRMRFDGPAVLVGGDTLLDLVHPEHGGGHGCGGTQGLAQVALGLPVVLVVQGAEVQAQQRHAPGTGHRLGGEALAAALHAQEQDALGRVQPRQ